MRITVKAKDVCLVIPCGEGRKTVQWLVCEAVERSTKAHEFGPSLSHGLTKQPKDYYLCLPNDGGILWPEDIISEVLENDGFVELRGNSTAFTPTK